MGSTPTAPALELPVGIAADRSGLTRLQVRALVDSGEVQARVVNGFLYVDVASLNAVGPRGATSPAKGAPGHG